MGLFDKLFGHRPKEKGAMSTFRLLNGYTPVFTTRSGELYEDELIRAAIAARATHISKLQVITRGAAKPALQRKLSLGPNEMQTWSQFLRRLSTILDIHNTAFITPVYDVYGEASGIYTVLPNRCEIAQADGTLYLRYEFSWGEHAAIELSSCGILTQHQYKSDFFGESNAAIRPTMELIDIQNQGIREGVKSAASYRFMARLINFAKAEDLEKERKRFTKANLSRDAEGGGLLLFPNTYGDIKQLDVKPWVVDAEQMKIIKENVYQYFGVNDDILQNRAYGDEWSAFYEGAIEPFAVQLAQVLEKMLFTTRERAQGNDVAVTANRLQYMSNADKLAVSSGMLDRGIMSINDVRQIWNLPPVEGGDTRIIRGEYYSVSEKVGGNDDAENDA